MRIKLPKLPGLGILPPLPEVEIKGPEEISISGPLGIISMTFKVAMEDKE